MAHEASHVQWCLDRAGSTAQEDAQMDLGMYSFDLAGLVH